MAVLNSKPGSSSAKQRQRLVILGRRRGMELAEIRSLVGGSISKLSSAAISDWIHRFGGGDLPNPPGKKPPAYAKRQRGPANLRMISPDQVEQITRLMFMYFDGNEDAAASWLDKNFGNRDPQQLATARRGGEVIAVLKAMHNRRDLQESTL